MGGAFALAVVVVIAPWAVRNYREFERPIITTTHGGYTLALANNPLFYRHLVEQRWFVPWDSEPLSDWIEGLHPSIFEEDEIRQDGLYRSEALDAIRAEPGMFCVASVYRLSRLWGICPLATETNESLQHRARALRGRRVLRARVCPGRLGGLAGGPKLASRPWLWGLLLVLSVTAVHTVYWTDMRMRAPLVSVIALAAGAGLSGKGSGPRGQALAAQGFAASDPAANLP